eukprot:1142785_1
MTSSKDTIATFTNSPSISHSFSKPPNGTITPQQNPTINQPLSISQIQSFKSIDDTSRLTPVYGSNSRRRSNRNLYAKAKLNRVVSARFGVKKNVIYKALSQFLTDEEFDERAMRTDLLDEDGYIIDHLAVKFNWDDTTREQFHKEIQQALLEENASRRSKSLRSRSTMGANDIVLPLDMNTSSVESNRGGSIHFVNYNEDPIQINEDQEEEYKYLPDHDTDSDMNAVDNNTDIAPIVISLKPPADAIPIVSTNLGNFNTLTPPDALGEQVSDDHGDEIGLAMPRSYTQAQRSIAQHIKDGTPAQTTYAERPKKTRYPEYVIKAIFYAADDEHAEVLLDQAINFIANDLRFSYLWHDEDFIKLLYNDKTYYTAVEKLMREITDIAHIDGADFFHHFVDREYDRERKDYLRDLLNAQEVNREGGASTDTASSGYLQVESRVKTENISDATLQSKYTLKFMPQKESNNLDKVFDAQFKIRKYKVGDNKKYLDTNPYYFALPNCAPNGKFMWAQFQRKKIKRYGGGNKAHGYWKLLRADNTAAFTGIDINEQPYADGMKRTPAAGGGEEVELQKLKKKKKKKKAPPIPVSHLNLILGLVRFILKQKKLEKDKTWIYDKFELEKAFTFTAPNSVDKLLAKKDISVRIQKDMTTTQNESVESPKDLTTQYKISWFNGGDAFDSCVALAIRKDSDPNKFYFYLCFKADIEDKIEWQWYNNDESYFQKYELGFATFAQLEASFQANLHTNFPFNIMPSANNLDGKKIEESPFNLPCIPEMVAAMKPQQKKKTQHYIIRYLFTRSRRIQDMEQLSVNRGQPEYPRRIKRMIAGTNRNTLFGYFLADSDFVNEWKERFLLSEETQVYYFWSFILSIATTMKYMELELENQLITFSFRRSKHMAVDIKSGVINSLDTSDLRREMRDLDLFEGFIVPPLQIMQTQDVWNSAEDQLKPRDWYRTLSTVGTLKKRKYYDSFGGTLHTLECRRKKNGLYETCPHDFHADDYPWKGQLGTLYCDRCANMMRFGEYLRKFCLEYENRELMQFLWPWHKNTFHAGDQQKYHEAIARQNFNFLFDSEDLLNYVPIASNRELIGDEGDEKEEEENMFYSIRQNKHLDGMAKHQALRRKELVFEAHIRHKRKYAARFMLGAWESLKNLNIIKIQMGAVFEQLEVDRVHAEVASAAKESMMTQPTQRKEWRITKEEWPHWLSKWNATLGAKLRNNDWLMILKLNKFRALNVAELSPKQLPNWDSFLTWALSPIYYEKYCQEEESVSFSSASSSSSDGEEYKASLPQRIKSEATLQRAMEKEWRKKFSASWTRVPSWWHIGHDCVLIDLAVQCQFNERKYYRALTARGAYYRMRLNESIGEQDYTQDVAFQEFKNWCIRWENIMHRVRYISAVAARQISTQIQPSIVDLLIDDVKDRPKWSCQSLVFLNDNQGETHVSRIRTLPKPHDFAATIKSKHAKELNKLFEEEEAEEEEESHFLVMNKFQNNNRSMRMKP